MTGLLWVLAALALISIYGVVGVITGRIERHGFLVLAWRFLTGHPWHGKELTDAGWLRPGRRALTRTGHASRFHHRPRWQRTMIRSGSVLGIVLALYGMVASWGVTMLALQAAAAAALAYGSWRAWRAWHGRKHRRTWVDPLHVVCAPLVGIPVANSPKSWLAIEPDRSKAVLSLPPGRDFSDPKTQEQITRAAAAKLGIEAPDFSWRLGGPEPTLTIRRSEPPPDKVTLADIRAAIDDAGLDVLVCGLGKGRKPVTISLHGDSPHVGLTMGSGGGKSVTAGFFLAQMLYKGSIGLVLDPKRISHVWARDLPNVAYARDDDQLHAALLWLAGEVDRRNRVADVAADIEGVVQANVGPRIFVVAEELNAMMKRLRSYWRKIRESGDPVRSPALDALDEVMFTGRQVRVNVLMIGQRLSAEATGGGDSRENLAALVFARYRPATWKMLVPDLPMPPATRHVGRAEVVTSGVRQTQIAFLTGRERRDIALAGRLAVCPAGMPYAGPPLTVEQKQEIASHHPDLGNETVSGTSGPPAVSGAEPVSLSAAVAGGIVPAKLAAARTARHRDERFPQPVGRSGLANLYDPVELADYYAARESS